MRILKHKTETLFVLLFTVICLSFISAPAQAAENMINSASAVSGGKLLSTSKGYRYQLSNGSYVKSKWVKINNKVYYFKATGYTPKGWFKYKKNYYYASKKGRVLSNSWVTVSGKKYFLKSDGIRAASTWLKISGKYYYFNKKGVMQVNSLITSGKKTYYVNSKGVRVTKAWVTLSGKKYYFGADGVCYKKCWVKYKGKYYYLKTNGAMGVSAKIGKYYVGSDGARIVNCYYNGVFLDETGLPISAKAVAAEKAKVLAKQNRKVMIVGDSRTVGMDISVSENGVSFLGKVGAGYTWLSGTADSKVRTFLKSNPYGLVVFAFGVNDLGYTDKYIAYYKKLMSSYPNADFFYMAVNPIESRAANAWLSNSKIEAFNRKLKNAFGAKYIDTYKYLKDGGFSTFDGIHYTVSTYKKLYSFVKSKIGF